MFGQGALPQVIKDFPTFFGKEIYISSKVFEESISIPNHQSIWDACFENNPEAEIEEIGGSHIISMLDSLDIQIKDTDDSFFIELEAIITESFEKIKDKMEKRVQEIFRMQLPNKLVIILDEYGNKNNSFGQKLAVNRNIGVISYSMGRYVLKKDKNEPISVIIHELLHVLFSKYNVIKNTDRGFEEALLRYFAPYGLLSEVFGFQSHRMAGNYLEQITSVCSMETAQKLNNLMMEYTKVVGQEDIWSFLLKTDFKSYINTDFLNAQ
jgi:hypothetical protein